MYTIVGWVVACFPVGVRSETQQIRANVAFPSTEKSYVPQTKLLRNHV
ncbi:hypothetical protein NSP_27410 [Nodularia spumigena CCY9414]|nr:hypothetical protein NSP_27410 [Nodularia spumigena CCY9414]